MRILLTLMIASFLCGGAFAQEKLTIRYVSADKIRINQGANEKVTFGYHISKQAETTLKIYDARDVLVYSQSSEVVLNAGRHFFGWNGVTNDGRAVPAEAYHYVIEAKDLQGNVVRYDLTDVTGGKTVVIEGIKYDKESQTLQYRVTKPVRIFMRAGLKNGPFLKTLVNGAIRHPGLIKEKWNGFGESELINIVNHPNQLFYGDAWGFSRNTIHVMSADKTPFQPLWMEGLDRANARPKGKKPFNLNPHAYQNREASRDVKVSLKVLTDTEQTEDRTHLVNGDLLLQIDVLPEDAVLLEQQRFEVVFFLNGNMIYENEVSYLPYNWTWKNQNLTEGDNYLSAFIVGFGGHYGVGTIRLTSK